MLFNSPEFLFWFLPITVAGFFVFGHFRLERIAVAWLVFASLFFYAWWRLDYLVILAGSIVVNYAIGRRLIERPSGLLLGAGVGANLLVLGYFKYSLFLVDNVNWMFGTSFSIGAMLLPLGISFFTFQQIAYLIDCKSGITTEKSLLNYSLFVSFFPQLIAGPIVHHKEMLPQFAERSTFKPNLENIVIGLSIFGIGLFKKVVIADRIAVHATESFNAALAGATLTFVEAWAAALTFTLQLYFDFSGYSDMAVGLALMFGVRIPINFNSPFKAVSIIEFWQRWHMTLTRFLTMYLYNPIVMTLTRRRLAAGKPLLQRKSTRFGPFVILLVFPTMFTMFWAGIWHGAGYQYLIFGVLHGSYIVINHAWRLLRRSFDIVGPTTARVMRPFGVLLTFCAVVASLVFFRAESVPQAMSVLEGMAGLNGVYIPAQWQRLLGPVNAVLPSWIEFAWIPYVRTSQVGILGILMLVVWFCPNTQDWIAGNVGAGRSTGIFAHVKKFAAKFQLGRILYGWSPSPTAAVWVGLLISLSILEIVSEAPSEFLYFNF
jgi:D-alanyl-lipoteichoic acid acyltransferase DltB (MBOAT superfamily)